MTLTPHITALIVAAGVGERAGGDVPKQYRAIGGRAMLWYSVAALRAHPGVREVRVVIAGKDRALYDAATQGLGLPEPVIGGARRQDSVRAGLEALGSANPDYVLIHDAARPFLSHAMIDRLIDGAAPDRAVLPGLVVHDTVRRMAGDTWESVPRDGLVRMQTPQCFPYAKIRELHQRAVQNAVIPAAAPGSPGKGHISGDPGVASQTGMTDEKRAGRDDNTITDDAALWLDAGGQLAYVEGDERLRKVTHANDFLWAETQLHGPTRTAMGYDVHKLVPHGPGEEKIIRLGGLSIAHDFKLEGHSDADVVLHAITDALLGTIADGDIGAHFPPSDPQWKGADSAAFLKHAAKLVHAQGGRITHIDATILCEAPKIAPHRDAMRAFIAGLLGLELSAVSIKATTTEGLGFTGRREGIACHAVANVVMGKA